MPVDQNFKDKKIERPLAIGTDIFTDMPGSYYVDKTLLAKDIIDSTTKVILFTRPRRFGKTLNMTMLQTFFEKTLDGKDTSHYFTNLQIWQKGEKYRAEQGKRPVIFITFKDTKCSAYQDTITEIKKKIANEFGRHSELAKSEKLDDSEKQLFSAIKERKAPDSEYSNAFETLSRMLCRHYGEQTLVLIDEYDAPIQAAYDYGFYDKMVVFMRNFLSSVFKTNPSLYRGILTGITRVSKESIFSGLNNLRVNTIFDKPFSQYFGITSDELKEMLDFYGIPEKYAEMKEWYDGYDFGGLEIYNPWSVINYIESDCQADAYWVNTSGNSLIGEALHSLDEKDRESLPSLLTGGEVEKQIDTNMIYSEIYSDEGAAFSLLAQSGYLKSTRTELIDGIRFCTLTIPNKEVRTIYPKEIINRFAKDNDALTRMRQLNIAIIRGRANDIQKAMQAYLMQICSSFDLTEEKDYHNFFVGLLAAAVSGYEVKSNRESGEGRYDIMLFPKKPTLPGIIFELKHCKATKAMQKNKDKMQALLKAAAIEALKQIDIKNYAAELTEKGAKQIIKYGAAFSGKQTYVEIA